MIEKDLEEIVESVRYLPEEIVCEFKDVSYASDWTLEQCWDSFSDQLIKYGAEIGEFWDACGYPADKTKKKRLLNQLRPAVLSSVFYFGMDYLFRNDSNEQNCKVKYSREYLRTLFKDKFYNAYEEYSEADNTLNEYVEKYYDKSRKALSSLQMSLDFIRDQNDINPYPVFLQKQEFSEKHRNVKRTVEFDTFLPDILTYLQKTITKENGKWIINTLIRPLFILLLDNSESLPGHKNVSAGKYSLRRLKSIDNKITHRMESDDFNLDKALPNDPYNGAASLSLIWYGIEDLFHLNRISFAIEKLVDYANENSLSEVELHDIAPLFSTLVYAPSTGIQEIMLEDIIECSNERVSGKNIGVESPVIRRVLSLNSVVFPSIVSLFSCCLFYENGGISINRVREILSTISTDLFDEIKNAFGRKDKVWDNEAYFRAYPVFKQGKEKFDNKGWGDSFEYEYAFGVDCALPIEDLLQVFLRQENYTWKNSTIILSNILKTTHLEVLFGKRESLMIGDISKHHWPAMDSIIAQFKYNEEAYIVSQQYNKWTQDTETKKDELIE